MTVLSAARAGALLAEPPSWVQVLPIGIFSGRDGRGPWVIRDRAAAERIVAETHALAGGARLPIDYDHQTEFAADRTAPAAGWISELQVRPNGIWARVEWTTLAAARIRAREYRYLSPVFQHARDGTVLRLLRASLTNKPNVDLAALASAAPIAAGVELSAEERAVCATLGIEERAYAATKSAEIASPAASGPGDERKMAWLLGLHPAALTGSI